MDQRTFAPDENPGRIDRKDSGMGSVSHGTELIGKHRTAPENAEFRVVAKP